MKIKQDIEKEVIGQMISIFMTGYTKDRRIKRKKNICAGCGFEFDMLEQESLCNVCYDDLPMKTWG